MILLSECLMWRWISELNPIEIGLGFMLGIVGSGVFAVIYERIKSNKITSRYKKIDGVYIRYWKENKVKGENKIFAKAILKQIIENRFERLLKIGSKSKSSLIFTMVIIILLPEKNIMKKVLSNGQGKLQWIR